MRKRERDSKITFLVGGTNCSGDDIHRDLAQIKLILPPSVFGRPMEVSVWDLVETLLQSQSNEKILKTKLIKLKHSLDTISNSLGD